jgi:large repetitive protein
LGSVAVQSDGTAVLSTSALPVGASSIVGTYSGDATYASSLSSPLTQTITQPPTLAPTIGKNKVPSAVVAGTPVKGSVTAEVTNTTGALIKGHATVQLFASTGDGIDGSATLVTQVVKSFNAKPGKTTAVTLKIKGSLPAGSFTFFVRVIDPSGNVNDSAAGPAITAAPPFVALSEIVTKNTLPTSGASGAKAKGALTLGVTNNGNVVTPNTTTLQLFATTDGEVDGSAIGLVTLAKKIHIKPGKTTRVTLSLKALPIIPVGNYTLVIQVTDGNGQVTTVTLGALAITA